MRSKKILFISHNATRTGAPVLLLHFLTWLKANTSIPFHILLREGGELVKEFEALAPVSVLYHQPSMPPYWLTKLLFPFGLSRYGDMVYFHNLKECLKRQNIGVIYANTGANGDVLEFLDELGCPVICHVHELEFALRHYVRVENFAKVIQRAHQFIAVSKAVKRNLHTRHAVPNTHIDVVYGYLPLTTDGAVARRQACHHIRTQLQLPLETLIVCAAGTTMWHKGPDLFIQLAYTVRKKYPAIPIYFLWLGGEKYERELMHDITLSGLEQSVCVLGAQKNPLPFLAACDMFTLVSREDSFPLVCLEAALFENPIICFDRAGGAKEFVEPDAGFVVPYLDIEAMAEKIYELASCPTLREELGRQARQKVQKRHDIEVMAPKILNIITRYLHVSSPGEDGL